MLSPDLGRNDYAIGVVQDALGHKNAEAKKGITIFPVTAVADIIIGRAQTLIKEFESKYIKFTPRNFDEYLEFTSTIDQEGIVVGTLAKIMASVGLKEIELGYWKGWSETKPGTAQRKEPGWSYNGLIDGYNAAVRGTHLPNLEQGLTEFNSFGLSIIHRRSFQTEQASADAIARTVKTSSERGYPNFGHYYESYHRMLELPILAGMLRTALQPHEIPEICKELTESQREIAVQTNQLLQEQNKKRDKFLTVLRRQTLNEGIFIQSTAELLVIESQSLQLANR